MAYPYRQPKASESDSDLLPLEDGLIRSMKTPSRLPAWLSNTLFYLTRILLLIWVIVVFAASCLIISFLTMPELRLAEDPTQNIPSFPNELQEFHLGTRYTADPKNMTEAELARVKKEWDGLIPLGSGMFKATVNLDQLPPAQWDDLGKENIYNVAIYHELHCLYGVMVTYYGVVMGKDPKLEHSQHCFEYLRLALMCHADTTLEGANDIKLIHDQLEEKGGNASSKKGALHVCKNYGQIYDWMQNHRVEDSKDILG